MAEQSEDAVRPVPSDLPPHVGAEPLGAVYLHVIRELTSLLSQMQADPQGSGRPYQTFLPPQIPKPQQIRQSLRLAQQGLRDLRLLLSRS
ncbi:MAG TPA: hypothetical protein VIN67_07965 [Desulfobaccales bacterium]